AAKAVFTPGRGGCQRFFSIFFHPLSQVFGIAAFPPQKNFSSACSGLPLPGPIRIFAEGHAPFPANKKSGADSPATVRP
ncbi:MAG: hypothetical protein Q4F72_06685, partial [Desulfovibrionaceae bacterium]|nr:hypothetical protein [Desulfovibrionaceae bacterium]